MYDPEDYELQEMEDDYGWEPAEWEYPYEYMTTDEAVEHEANIHLYEVALFELAEDYGIQDFLDAYPDRYN